MQTHHLAVPTCGLERNVLLLLVLLLPRGCPAAAAAVAGHRSWPHTHRPTAGPALLLRRRLAPLLPPHTRRCGTPAGACPLVGRCHGQGKAQQHGGRLGRHRNLRHRNLPHRPWGQTAFPPRSACHVHRASGKRLAAPRPPGLLHCHRAVLLANPRLAAVRRGMQADRSAAAGAIPAVARPVCKPQGRFASCGSHTSSNSAGPTGRARAANAGAQPTQGHRQRRSTADAGAKPTREHSQRRSTASAEATASPKCPTCRPRLLPGAAQRLELPSASRGEGHTRHTRSCARRPACGAGGGAADTLASMWPSGLQRPVLGSAAGEVQGTITAAGG